MAAPAKLRAVPSLGQLVQSFPKRKVLVIGDLVADHYIYGADRPDLAARPRC